MTADAQLLTRAVGEAARLLEADGAMIYLLDDATGRLRFAHDAGIRDPTARRLIRNMELSPGVGMFGTAFERRELIVTDDYPNDERFVHFGPADEVVSHANMRSMVAAPMIANDVPIGAMGAYSSRQAAFSEAQITLLRALADHAAAAIGNQRLLERLAESEARSRARSDELAHRVEAQATLQGITAQITAIRDPEALLQAAVDAAKRLLGSDGAHLTLRDATEPVLRPHVMAGGTDEAVRTWLTMGEVPIGGGMNGLAAEHDAAVWTTDYLVDPRISHTPDDQEVAGRLGLRGMAVAPLRALGGGVIGTIAISYREPREIAVHEVELLQGLADICAIGIENARLLDELAESEQRSRHQADDLARVVEAQRALAAIAAQISSIRDPTAVLRRTMDEALRLLGADHAVINQLEAERHILQDIGGADLEPLVDSVPIPIGLGVAGAAIEAGAVRWTGNYVEDPGFEHVAAADEWMRERGFASQMSAPLAGEAGPIGALTIYAQRPHAFDASGAELLGALAAQAAVAITNARLYAQQRESERRYRYLVDHSPDLVWSVDADGRFTYLGESLERITGHRPEELLGQHWEVLTEPTTVHVAEAGWRAIVERPDEDQQLRIQLRLAGGGAIPAEINMIGTTVDGRFAGAHGSIRDVRERERLELDLRRRSAELAATAERANLARDLHDSVTQALFSMGLTLRTLELLLERDPDAAQAKLAELRQLQRDALAEMRNLIFELRPGSLESDGLPQALRTHAAAVEGRTGLAVSTAVDLEERMPLDVEEALYRIAQEALHNVVKHANATSARIVLRRTGRRVHLGIEDDGVGFDPERTPRGHLGLVGMRQRAERIGADFEVGARPSGGTRVRVTLPLHVLTSAQ